MDKMKQVLSRLAEGVDLPGEPIPGVSIMELLGDDRVLIEHHRGITQYGCDQICVRVSFGSVLIQGEGLSMSQMTSKQVVIVGTVHSIQLERGN